jgi:hypothetical protein
MAKFVFDVETEDGVLSLQIRKMRGMRGGKIDLGRGSTRCR